MLNGNNTYGCPYTLIYLTLDLGKPLIPYSFQTCPSSNPSTTSPTNPNPNPNPTTSQLQLQTPQLTLHGESGQIDCSLHTGIS